MLRISEMPRSSDRSTLLLEGRLRGPWVEELRRSVAALGPVARVILDLQGLEFADAEGVALLRALRAEGAEIASASTFMTSLMGDKG
jgi:ABC-type transporter Mla MlaB component